MQRAGSPVSVWFKGPLYCLSTSISLAPHTDQGTESFTIQDYWINEYTVTNSSKSIVFTEGVPGGSVVKKLPANARDTGLIPDQENPTCHRATKPVRHNYWACAPQQEKPPTMRSLSTPTREQSPLTATREKLTQQQRPSTANNI